MRTLSVFVAVGLSVFATGCGGTTPTQPETGGSAISSIAIIGPDAVLTSASASYTASATRADGTTRAVTTWTSSNPAVATIDTAGHLLGVSHWIDDGDRVLQRPHRVENRARGQQLRGHLARDLPR